MSVPACALSLSYFATFKPEKPAMTDEVRVIASVETVTVADGSICRKNRNSTLCASSEAPIGVSPAPV